VIFEILSYYTWIHSLLILVVNVSSSVCLVDRPTIVKWCRRAGERRLTQYEYGGLAWGFLLFFALESSLGSDYDFWELFYLYAMLDLYGDPVVFIWCIVRFIFMMLRPWDDFRDCCLFRCETLMKNVFCMFWV